MRTAGLGLTALLLLTFQPPGAEAQEGSPGPGCGYVAECWGFPATGNHALVPAGSPNYNHLHRECKICYRNGEPTGWRECHDPCELAEVPEAAGPGYVQAYRELIAAASGGDVDRALLLAVSVPRHAVLNDERGSLQIRACDGRALIANIPLDSSRLALASRLYRNTSAMAHASAMVVRSPDESASDDSRY